MYWHWQLRCLGKVGNISPAFFHFQWRIGRQFGRTRRSDKCMKPNKLAETDFWTWLLIALVAGIIGSIATIMLVSMHW